MLRLKLTVEELYDEEICEFSTEQREILLEHSLLAISKWETIWEKAFLYKKDKTAEELASYLKCMCVREEDEQYIPFLLKSKEKMEEVTNYMNRKMTAAWFWEDDSPKKASYVTSEDIYYQMFGNGIPKECETWPIKRLLALIRTFQEKQDDKKISPKELAERYRALNKKRREQWNSKG